MAPTNIAAAEASGSFCTTPTCLALASEIITSLAPNYTDIDPCTDFDKLACEGWRSTHVPTGGRGQISSLGVMDNSVMVVLRNILEGPYRIGPDAGFLSTSLSKEQIAIDQENFKLITDTYNACMNKTTVDAAGLKPLLSLIDSVVEAFPVTNGGKSPERMISKDDAPEMGKALLLFGQHGIQTFETLSVDFDDQDTSKTLVSVQPGGRPLLRGDNARNNQTTEEYLRVMARVLEAVYPGNITLTKAQTLAVSITKFEKEADALKSKDDTKQDESSPARKFSLQNVTSVAPELNHEFVIKNLIPSGYTPNEIVFSPGYFGNLSALLSNTTAETVQGYFIWTATRMFSQYVEAEVTERLEYMKSKLGGNDPAVVGTFPRWYQCTIHVDEGVPFSALPGGLGWILGRFFLDRAYSQEARQLATDMMSTIQKTFISRLGEKDWLTSQVKKTAEEKVNAVTKKIGYPDISPNTADPSKLKEYFSGLKVGPSLFENAVTFAKFSTSKMWSMLGKPTDKGIWFQTPTTTNAYYFTTFNDIVINAGIQQKPSFAVDYPSYVNYAGLGTVLGHELTHGFDNSGHNYAANGSLVNWWDDQSTKNFEERTKCFAEQYSKYSVTAPNGTQVHVSGNRTLGENIADGGGLTTAFDAWKKLQQDKNAKDFDLPGLEKFSHDQLFFVKYAQNWCETSVSRELDIVRLADVHAPGFARIKGPLDNSAAFRKAFNCPVQKPTCELW
ncbi:Endothelin-converting enzyme 2-like protein 1 [Colletotrichum chlorophyti]|uniref:Endothelin-converting enzyme 2-like protein 1 n=1 Tax=Colletotrichum chlorophyti TaxID=708187 RepID=A0A1Q8S6Y0_9PEZI|nr:Endothelin-converting enzyme 2-like protein 1 [Colletotrichum chlorophyti]